MADLPIGTHHLLPNLSYGDEQLQHCSHAVVKELVDSSLLPILIGEALLELGVREIS
jgi:hypothetical protein